MANESLFDGADQVIVDPEKDHYSELVGEGKRYKDNQAAGRALVEKDVFIEQLKKEAAEAREAAQKAKSMQELVDQIESKRANPAANPPVTTPETVVDPNPNPATKVEDVVRKLLSEHSETQRASDNRRKVADVLRANFGPGFAKVLAERAEAMGLGQKTIDDIAGRSPAAIFQLMGVSETAKTNVAAAPAVRTNPGAVAGNNKKNFAYYENIRKTDKNRYFSLTQEMIEQATAMGDDFYR